MSAGGMDFDRWDSEGIGSRGLSDCNGDKERVTEQHTLILLDYVLTLIL